MADATRYPDHRYDRILHRQRELYRTTVPSYVGYDSRSTSDFITSLILYVTGGSSLEVQFRKSTAT